LPQERRGGGRRRHLQGVEGPRAVTAKKDILGAKILHKNTKRVKLDGNIVISTELTDR
jgi:hypothetical protein